MAENAILARALYEAWNERNFDALAESMASGGQIVVVGTGDTFQGPDAARQYHERWADGFPDGSITVDRILTSGDTVVVELTGRGTHTGTLATSMGSIPATGRSVTLKLCEVLEYRDERIESLRTYFDSGSLMAQLGLTAEQPETTKQ